MRFFIWCLVSGVVLLPVVSGGTVSITIVNDSTTKTVSVHLAVHAYYYDERTWSLGPGASQTYESAQAWAGTKNYHAYYNTTPPTPCSAWDTGIVGYSEGASLTLHCGAGCEVSTPCPITADNPTGAMHRLTVGVHNPGATTRIIQLYQNGSPLGALCSGGSGNRMALNPGQTGTMMVLLCDTNGVSPEEIVGQYGLGSSGSGADRLCYYEPVPDGNSYARQMGPSEFGWADSYTGASNPGVGDGAGGLGVGYTDAEWNSGTNGLNFGGRTNGGWATEPTARTGFSALWFVGNEQYATQMRIEDAIYRLEGLGVASTNLEGGTYASSLVLTNLGGQMVQLLSNMTNFNASYGVASSNMMVANSNQFRVMGTNLAGMSNLMAWGTNQAATDGSNISRMEKELANLTNSVGGLSNLFGSGMTNKSDVGLSGLATNAALAWEQGVSEADGLMASSGLAGRISDAHTIGGGIADPGGQETWVIPSGVQGIDGFAISLVGGAKSLGVASFSGILDVIRRMITYVLYLGYAAWIATTLYKAFGDISTARGVDVQPMDVSVLGTGGNAVGVAVWTISVMGVLIIWAAAMALLFTTSIGGQDWPSVIVNLVSNPVDGASASHGPGIHMVFSAFPLALAVSLVAARITWRFTLVYVVAVCRFAVRWIPGA